MYLLKNNSKIFILKSQGGIKMKIVVIKISKALERTQINLEKMINDSSKVNECIKVIKKFGMI